MRITAILGLGLLASTQAVAMGNGCPQGQTNYFNCSSPRVMTLCGLPDGSGLHLLLEGIKLGKGASYSAQQLRPGTVAVGFDDDGVHYQLYDDESEQGLVIETAKGKVDALVCKGGYNSLQALAGRLPVAE